MTTSIMNARAIVREAAEKLEAAGVPEPTASAEILMSEVLGIGWGEFAMFRGILTVEQSATYESWISRRIDREPVQRIIGRAYFRNVVLELDEYTLIPRSDTESVVDAALESVDSCGGGCRVLDLGTGSGAIAISISSERPNCEIHATDTSKKALDLARQNATANNATVHFHHSDIAANLENLQGSVDVMVSNPPYIPSTEIKNLPPEVRDWDPATALDGGPDGLHFYRRVLAEMPPMLVIGADIVLEVGDGQADDVLALGEDVGFVALGTRKDLAGSTRVVILQWNG